MTMTMTMTMIMTMTLTMTLKKNAVSPSLTVQKNTDYEEKVDGGGVLSDDFAGLCLREVT